MTKVPTTIDELKEALRGWPCSSVLRRFSISFTAREKMERANAGRMEANADERADHGPWMDKT